MEIVIKNVTKKFKNNVVLNNVNLLFKENMICGLSGCNGSGKSVLLKIMCGLYKPSSGEVLYDNINYNKNNMFVPNTCALIEKPSFFPDLTGFENLKILAKIQNRINDTDIINALKTVNLIDEKDKKFSEYSLGMKQKLGIAQVIMENPKIMMLDEPFNGIEEKSVKKISQYLISEKNKGKIIIISSHIKEDLKELSDIIYYFESGKVTTDEK